MKNHGHAFPALHEERGYLLLRYPLDRYNSGKREEGITWQIKSTLVFSRCEVYLNGISGERNIKGYSPISVESTSVGPIPVALGASLVKPISAGPISAEPISVAPT